MVYVLGNDGKPLMPTERHGKVRRMLKDGRAVVVRAKPFTIRLTYDTTRYTQSVTLGIDAGYSTVGFSAASEGKELIAGECKLLEGQVERNEERRKYRRQRRNRKRYRAPRFDNRKKPEGWLAPSMRHKLESHVRQVNLIKSIVPVTEVVVEVATFDIQAIKTPGIEGKEYQQGEQAAFWNLREYILHRDGHQCQNRECKNRAVNPVLQVHHIGFWKNDRTDRPGNFITLCDKCHRPENHKESGFLWGWEPSVRSFRPETFMTMVRLRLTEQLGARPTFGHITKSKRIELGMEKTHANDAFCIAGGSDQTRCVQVQIEQVRRNNRCLRKFYDAQYVDRRTGEYVSAQTLNCGRRTRNKNKNGENLRVYRGKKLSKGRYQLRKKRYPYQPGDVVLCENVRFTVQGTQNHGDYVRLRTVSKPVRADRLKPVYYGKGLRIM
ncbi:MAG TPA: RNA-guided endonuclease IscB [Spirochaetia bacterium]|nr:RNA-guided endonuclease IscB [Spirochaetia bacterium]